MKKFSQLAISLGLTLLVGYLIYRGVPDWGQAWRVMIQGRPLFLLAGFGCVMLHMLLRAIRWGVLLTPVKNRVALKNLFSLTLIKYVVNVIPPRAGEVAASIILARKENVSTASVIAASILERILDMMTVVVIFGFYLSFFSHRYVPGTEHGREIMARVESYSLKGFVVLGLGFILLGYLLRNERWMNRLPQKLRKILRPFLEGFRGLQRGGVLLQAILLSLSIWMVITLQLWCMLHAYLKEFPFVGALFLMALTVVGVAIPTPGGVGGFQFFMNLALVHFFSNYLSPVDPQSQAAGISNGSYIVSMVPVIFIGLVFLNREGLSFSSVSRLASEKPE
jgi:uncharacterized protein (TIRG00374 family)